MFAGEFMLCLLGSLCRVYWGVYVASAGEFVVVSAEVFAVEFVVVFVGEFVAVFAGEFVVVFAVGVYSYSVH